MGDEMGNVFHIERVLEPGIDPRIREFFSWWNAYGSFPITIPPNGGLRTDSTGQAALFAQGRTMPGPYAGEGGYPPLGLTVTNARTLKDTPHGRGGAADAYPATLNKDRTSVVGIYTDDRDPKVQLLFTAYGYIAEDHGLVWGGRWRRKDYPHVEVPDWKRLPPPGQS
jgi:hypothetical protein